MVPLIGQFKHFFAAIIFGAKLASKSKDLCQNCTFYSYYLGRISTFLVQIKCIFKAHFSLEVLKGHYHNQNSSCFRFHLWSKSKFNLNFLRMMIFSTLTFVLMENLCHCFFFLKFLSNSYLLFRFYSASGTKG